jgi:hypothetical protein
MIEMLRIYSKGFLENVTIEKLTPDILLLFGIISSISCLFCPTPRRGFDDSDFL